jgi:hypothetical protein
MASNTVGPKGQLYANPTHLPGETSFQKDNNSSTYYNSAYYLAHQKQVQPIPTARNTTPLELQDFLPPDEMAAIGKAGKIVFHAVGDTGAAKVNRSQTAATALGHETAVASAMVAEVGSIGAAFFFHLGDIIYNFGEAQYYYDQFYEPYANYDRPIFAIPGNHDGMVFGPGSTAPQVPTLAAFLTNFCATAPGPSPDGGGISRSMMTQPGVYFSLDAPFVSIIGLYSNVLDGPGVISSQGKHFPVSDEQLDFLKAELGRLKTLRQSSPRAVILALHHPPLSADAKNGGSTGPVADIDACCAAAGFWPDMVLSGHAHLYQRFTRTVAKAGGKQTPYLVAGSGGFAATAPMSKMPAVGTQEGDYRLDITPIVDFGFLTITCDGKTLAATFKTADSKGVAVRDTVSVDLQAGKVTSTPPPAPVSGAGKAAAKKQAAPAKKQAAAGKAAKAPAKQAAPAKKRAAPAKKRAPAKKKARR